MGEHQYAEDWDSVDLDNGEAEDWDSVDLDNGEAEDWGSADIGCDAVEPVSFYAQ